MIRIGFYVELESHRVCVASIKHGKKLPDDPYLFSSTERRCVARHLEHDLRADTIIELEALPANRDKAFKGES